MNALQAMAKTLNVTRTENGDLAYRTTGSACLDLFSLCGGMRHNVSDLVKLFVKAYGENPQVAVKVLFYLRDIRGGLGERNSFRVLLTELAKFYPDTAKQIVYAVPQYGRWDDLLCLAETQVQDAAISVMKEQLEKDKRALESEGEVSLLGKWLPSINTSSKEKVHLAKIVMTALGMKACEYRKLCSALRAEIKILENNLRLKDYTFDYSKQPSQAMLRYKKAFIRNDGERYGAYLKQVMEQTKKIARGEEIDESEKVKLNTKTLFPYQIVAPFLNNYGWRSRVKELSAEEKLTLEASWCSLERGEFVGNTIVVRDGSGSMYHGTNDSPINIATSLALLFSEQLSGAYKNCFVTFSERPQLVQIPDVADTLQKKLHYITQFDEVANTDIGKVYELLLSVALNANVQEAEMIERVLIISDMEFDSCAEGVGASTFEYWKTKFGEAGYELPEIVFWNVAARGTRLPVTMNESGVKLVSGASANIFASVVANDLKVVTPYEFMLQVLAPYAEFDKIVA